MRCPHCATAVAVPPECHVCGGRLDAPLPPQPTVNGLEPTRQDDVQVQVDTMPGLEPSRVADVEVSVERMPGLVTNDEALGNTRIPDGPVEAAASAPTHCPRCRAALTGGRFCDGCGRVVAGKRGAAEAASAPATVVCLECSVPNPPNRERCLSCGATL